MYVPTGVFWAKGFGSHPNEIASFEMALRAARIAAFNLVPVSSIFPPPCRIVTRSQGLKRLKPGQIVHCVLSKVSSREPGQRLAASIGFAIPSDIDAYGCFFEHQATGKLAGKAGRYAADLSAEMLATLRGVRIVQSWSPERRRKAWLASGKIKRAMNVTQKTTAEAGNVYTTAVVAAVLLP